MNVCKRIIVIVHIFYPEFWCEIKSCLKNITLPFDMVVTFVAEHPEIEKDVLQFYPDASIIHCENKGFDVGPFFVALNSVDLSNYDYLIKLHTKRNIKFSEFPQSPVFYERLLWKDDVWRKKLLNFISGKDVFNRCIEMFNDPGVGMVAGDQGLLFDYCTEKASGDPEIYKQVENLFVKNYLFVAGTMFIARTSLFSSVLSSASAFEITDRNDNQSLAHMWERQFGAIVYQKGMRIEAAGENINKSIQLKIYAILYPVLKFLFHKKITRSNHLLVKVLKVPVFRKKIK